MSDKLTNMTVRAFTGVLFVTIMVTCFFQPVAMVFLFALITCLSLWEYSGLVNNIEDVTINRFISTVAGVYLFLAISAVNSGFVQTNAVFMPYLLTIIYLFVSELYTKNKNAVHDLSYTMLGQMYVALPLSIINVLAFRTATDGNIHFYYLLRYLCYPLQTVFLPLYFLSRLQDFSLLFPEHIYCIFLFPFPSHSTFIFNLIYLNFKCDTLLSHFQ